MRSRCTSGTDTFPCKSLRAAVKLTFLRRLFGYFGEASFVAASGPTASAQAGTSHATKASGQHGGARHMPVVDWGLAISYAATIASALCVIVSGLEFLGD